jgi:2-iminoacetate synthase ThiH
VRKVANELRRRAVGDQVTYVLDRNLNFTNVCVVGCAFCGFGKSARAGNSFEENLLVHALARLLLQGHIKNIQVSWVKLGFEGARACLEAGANDFGGTLMEKSISRSAGANFGEAVMPSELRALIRTIGRTPAERTRTYKIRRVFEQPDPSECLPLERLAGRTGSSVLRDQVRS